MAHEPASNLHDLIAALTLQALSNLPSHPSLIAKIDALAAGQLKTHALIRRAHAVQMAKIDAESNELAAELQKLIDDLHGPDGDVIADRIRGVTARLTQMGRDTQPLSETD